MGLIQKYKNWRNAENRAPINIKNVIKVFQAWYRKYFLKEIGGVKIYILEQVEYRKKISNIDCINSNVCKCGCTWDELIWSDPSCEGKCFPDMMDEKTWKVYKRKFKIGNDKGKS